MEVLYWMLKGVEAIFYLVVIIYILGRRKK